MTTDTETPAPSPAIVTAGEGWAPDSPYPDDADRQLARCPTHGNPLHWTVTAPNGNKVGEYRCRRKNPRGHVVPAEDVAWGPPTVPAGGRPAIGDVIGVRFGDVEEALRDRAAALEQPFSDTVREVCREGLAAIARKEARTRSRSSGTTTE